MKKVSNLFKTNSTNTSRDVAAASNVTLSKSNRIRPVGLTRVTSSSTSKQHLTKQVKVGAGSKRSFSLRKGPSKASPSKFSVTRKDDEGRKTILQRKEFAEQEKVDDKLLRDELRKCLKDKGPFDVSGFSNTIRNFNRTAPAPVYDDVRARTRFQDSARKSAWTEVREGMSPQLIHPSEKATQAWVLTDLEDESDTRCDDNPHRRTYSDVDLDSDTDSDDGSEFDTDLEDDCSGRKPFVHHSNEDLYKAICRKKGIIPVSYVSKRLNSSEILIPHHGLGPKGTEALTLALMNNTYVERLDVSDNDLQTEGALAFVPMLRENMYITDLNLSENHLHASAGIALSKELVSNTTIKRLSLKGNHLTDKVAVALAEMLKENRTIIELDLSYNEFGEIGGLYLGTGLSNNYGLKTLNLKWNSISGKGAESICHALATNESLTSLDVSWNGFRYTGALALSTYLPKNECLQRLNLRNNQIPEDGARKLKSALATHPHLVEIKLGMNPIGPAGVEAVFQAAKENPRLKYIGIEDISVPVHLLPLIEELENERNAVIITDKRTMKSVSQPKKAGLDILIEFLEENALRLREKLGLLDKERSGDVSRAEFTAALKEIGILMDSRQLDALIREMDKENTNTIDYSEILGAHWQMGVKNRRQTLGNLKNEKRHTQALNLSELHTIESGLTLN